MAAAMAFAAARVLVRAAVAVWSGASPVRIASRTA
jgi:hypothetical protein